MTKKPSSGDMRRISVASAVGSFVEWYDFYIYATAAALVFPHIFFPEFDPRTGTLIAFATFGAGFIARPVGAAVFGHFGDKIGRKSMLVISLLMMGIATTLMGLLPTYESVGVYSPIMLCLLRLIQGVAVGGEYGGAVLMATEHAPLNERGRYTGLVQAAVPMALVASTLAFLSLSSMLSDEQFKGWGWRIPFVASIFMVIIGYYIRTKIEESPDFMAVKAENKIEALPIVTVFRHHWKSILLIVGSYPAGAVTFFMINTFSITYGVESGISRTNMLFITLIAAVVMSALVPYFAKMADRVGYSRMFFLSLAVMALGAFPLFMGIKTAQIPLVLLGYALPTIGWSMFWGPVAVTYAELFGANVRYSGLSIGYMLATVVGGATPPIIAMAIYTSTKSTTAISIYMISMLAIGGLCGGMLMSQQETKSSRIKAIPRVNPYSEP